MSDQEKPLVDKIQEALQTPIVERHSFFQLKYFIVGKEPTMQAKLWRCLRELDARKKSLDSLENEIDEINDNKEMLDIETQRKKESLSLGSELDKRELGVFLRKQERKRKSLDSSLADLKRKKVYIEEEADFFLQSFLELQKVEALKPFDDLEAQTTYWNEKLAQEINLELLLRHPLDAELVRTILALDDQTPVKQGTIGLLKQLQGPSQEEAGKTLENKKEE